MIVSRAVAIRWETWLGAYLALIINLLRHFAFKHLRGLGSLENLILTERENPLKNELA